MNQEKRDLDSIFAADKDQLGHIWGEIEMNLRLSDPLTSPGIKIKAEHGRRVDEGMEQEEELFVFSLTGQTQDPGRAEDRAEGWQIVGQSPT